MKTVHPQKLSKSNVVAKNDDTKRLNYNYTKLDMISCLTKILCTLECLIDVPPTPTPLPNSR